MSYPFSLSTIIPPVSTGENPTNPDTIEIVDAKLNDLFNGYNQLQKDIQGQRINVKTQFGAIGNGTTNDRSAIQNAINAASNSSTVKNVYFPKGIYRVDKGSVGGTNINIPSGVRLIGDGKMSSIIDADNNANYIFELQGNNYVGHLGFRGLSNTDAGNGNEWTYVRMEGTSYNVVEYCDFTQNQDSAVRIAYGTYYCTSTSDDARRNMILFNDFRNSRTSSEASVIETLFSSESVIIGNRIINNQGHGIRVCGCRDSIIAGNYIEDNIYRGIWIQHSSNSCWRWTRDNIIIGNIVRNNGTAQIWGQINEGRQIIAYNVIDGTNQGISIGNRDPSGGLEWHVHNNVIRNCADGIVISGRTIRHNIHHNQIYNCTDGIVFSNNTGTQADNNIEYNLIANASTSSRGIVVGTQTNQPFVRWNKIFLGNTGNGLSGSMVRTFAGAETNTVNSFRNL